MKKRNNLIITILLIVVAAVIILYPKIKPLLASKSDKPGMAAQGSGRGPGSMQPRQILNVSGFLIKPRQLNDLYKSTGTLKPDEQVEQLL